MTIYFPGFVKGVGVKLVVYVETSLFVTGSVYCMTSKVKYMVFLENATECTCNVWNM
jgi:hypothetical protein